MFVFFLGFLTCVVFIMAFKSSITCKLCHSYFVDAATVNECMHTCKYIFEKNALRIVFTFSPHSFFVVCKTCIVAHLKEDIKCPACKIIIHPSQPLNYIRADKTMQAIVHQLTFDSKEG